MQVFACKWLIWSWSNLLKCWAPKTNGKKGWLTLSGLLPLSFPKQFLPAFHVNSVVYFTLNWGKFFAMQKKKKKSKNIDCIYWYSSNGICRGFSSFVLGIFFKAYHKTYFGPRLVVWKFTDIFSFSNLNSEFGTVSGVSKYFIKEYQTPFVWHSRNVEAIFIFLNT